MRSRSTESSAASATSAAKQGRGMRWRPGWWLRMRSRPGGDAMRSETDGQAGGRRASGLPAPPAVVVYYQSHPGAHEGLREIHAGLEEEGVLFRTEEQPDRDERAIELAHSAACVSTLAVGVGLDAHGA